MENNHLKLASFIKKVHEQLRQKSQLLGDEAAWESHCSDEDQLRKYATAMKELSLNFWETNFEKNKKAISRIKWTVETCVKYFTQSIEYFRQKEESVINKCNMNVQIKEKNSFDQKWVLLDVGSCYNPFKDFNYFDVIPIDIAPATSEVYKCDFLNVKIGKDERKSFNAVTSIKSKSFDVVVFSLLLEYLPSPKQRLECCERAYELLKTEGLLIIITPDSKHVGANAKLMKSWRVVLAKLGFYRIKYEKLPYIHCMAFRKSFDKQVTLNWVKLYGIKEIDYDIHIPQDFTIKSLVEDSNQVKVLEKPDEVIELLSELPGEY